MSSHPIEFTPKAYAIQYDGTPAGVKAINGWLRDHGFDPEIYLAEYGNGTVRLDTYHPDGAKVLSKFNWVVLYAGRLSVLDDGHYSLFSTGVKR